MFLCNVYPKHVPLEWFPDVIPQHESLCMRQTLSELMGDRSLEKFRIEYEKLHKALKKSHESEKRLMQKCRELNAEIVANSAKVATALKLSQEDQATIASLKKVWLYFSFIGIVLFVAASTCLIRCEHTFLDILQVKYILTELKWKVYLIYIFF